MDVKYKIIYDSIKDKILNKEYPTNSKIPDEITLCKEYNCSRMTMKKALDLLVQEGLLYRKRGQGSFVMSNNNAKGLIIIQERELQGLTKSSPGHVTSKVLEFKLEFANEEIANKLNINVDDPIYNIFRLRLVNNKPYVLERTYMPTSLIPGITLDVLSHSVYDYIENTLNLRIASANKTTKADVSNEVDHKYLNLKDIEPVLEIEQIAYLDNGIPYEYSIARHRYDLFAFNIFSVRR